MIRIGLNYDRRYHQWFEPIYDLSDLLKDLGIELLDEPSDPVDIRIVHSSIYLQEKQKRGGEPYPGPLVIWERVDQETVSLRNRPLLKLPHVVGWLKDHDIRDKALNNAPHVYGYWHYGLLRHDPQKYPATVPDVFLTPEDLSKITCLNNLAGYRTRFAKWRGMDPLGQKDRNIDVCFVGTVAYQEMFGSNGVIHHEILHDHRSACSRAMGKLVRHKTLLATNRAFTEPQYRDLLRRSKMVVSPYGYSMSSWKDWEAIYSGAVLVKPDSYQQVNYLPDLFEDPSRYVICDPNFEDLEQRVDEVLSNYDQFWERTVAARAALLTSRDKGQRAYDLYEQVVRWLDRAPAVDFAAFVKDMPNERRMLVDPPVLEPGESQPSQKALPQEPQIAIGAAGPNLLSGAVDIAKLPWSVVRANLNESVQAPTGQVAYKLTEDESETTHDVRSVIAHPCDGKAITVGFVAKAVERSTVHLWLGHRSLMKRADACFDLKHGRVQAAGATGPEWHPVRHGMTRLADGWWWCWMSAQIPSTSAVEMFLAIGGPTGQISYRGDGKSGLWLGGPRLERGNVATLGIVQNGSQSGGAEEDSVAKLGREFADYYEGYPRYRRRLGFHADFYLSRVMFHVLDQGDTFIETGTSSGDTIVYVARNYPRHPCYSCEASEVNFVASERRVATGRHSNVQLRLQKSPDFLYDLVKQYPALTSKRVVFWLDAHGHDFPCPLADEVAFITERFSAAAIAIDDFEVPGKPRFGFDRYKDASLTWDYIAPALASETRYQIIRPNYELHTSLHHPPRGWILIAKGDWSPIPGGLESMYNVSTIEARAKGSLQEKLAS